MARPPFRPAWLPPSARIGLSLAYLRSRAPALRRLYQLLIDIGGVSLRAIDADQVAGSGIARMRARPDRLHQAADFADNRA